MEDGEAQLGRGATGPEADVEAIRSALRTAAAAAEAGDVDGVLAMFVRDDRTRLFEIGVQDVTTLEGLRSNFETLFDGVEGAFTCRYPRIDVHVLSVEAAFSLAYMHVEGAMRDGYTLDLNERVTNVWTKVQGRWLAVHEHNSVPVDLGTGRFHPRQPI